MKKYLLRHLHCPFCGSFFQPKKILEEDDDDLFYGIIVCECNQYPIIEGILRLINDKISMHILRLLEKRQLHDAFTMSLQWPSFNRKTRFSNFLVSALSALSIIPITNLILILKRPLSRTFEKDNLSFCKTIDELKCGLWGEWLKYRFCMETFMPVLPLVFAIKNEKFVLDFGCGVGHSSFLISKNTDEEKLVCVDNIFANLYLGRKYFARKAAFICLDGNYLLPFEDRFFSTVFASDAFHFVKSKLSLSREFQRTLSHEGIIILSHLHNKSFHHQYAGTPLTPLGYKNLFHGLKVKLVPNESLISDFLMQSKMDLQKEQQIEEMDDTFGFSLIASHVERSFEQYENLWETYINKIDNLIVNPIYSVNKKGNTYIMTKKALSEEYKTLTETSILPLPNTFHMNEDVLDSSIGHKMNFTDSDMIDGLVRKLVLIAAPNNYN